ncbi:hypothetical protein RJ639_028447 [Escallonia herrerae]|uniref:Uncharacterized protein n=1 Tax=Escallonia herrerae TaxID=1293975 RepID=A0AA88X5C0_9ASTE|nr:hypothetical protein RJ639_028447 [Escallonia herrerae]
MVRGSSSWRRWRLTAVVDSKVSQQLSTKVAKVDKGGVRVEIDAMDCGDDQPRNKLEAPRRQEFKDCGLCRGWEGFRGLLVWIGLLELPLGSLMARLNNRGRTAPSSFAKVYESVRNLDSSYFATSNTKHSLLKPNLPSSNPKHLQIIFGEI